MASRFENRRYGRGRDREDFGGRYSPEFGRGAESRGGFGGSEYGRGHSDYERGEGYSGGRTGRDYGEWSGDYETGWGNINQPSRQSFGGRSDYESGYGGEQGRRFTGGGYAGRSGYGGANYGRGTYGPEYPESERGFMSDRDNQAGERGWWERTSDEVSSWFGDEEAERRREADARQSGQFRGRGPRNYTRSDDRIKEDINDRLTDNDFFDASDVEVEVNKGEVVLSGTVESRYAKRLAEDIAEDVSGVKNVENRIRVSESFSGQGSAATDTGATTGTSGTTGTAGTSARTGTTAGTASATGSTATGTAAASRGRSRAAGSSGS